MKDKKTVYDTKEMVSECSLIENFNSSLSPAGTLLMSFKLTVGRVSILGIDAIHNEAIISIFPYLNPNNSIRDWLLYTLGLIVEYVDQTDAIKGSTLNKEKMNSMLIPLPPLTEQSRIISKLLATEPLIAEYNEIERKLSSLESEFPEKLKKSILQYAIEGKLVRQDPNDEPASVLLERIKAEKERLIKEGKIKRDKNESYICQGDDKNYYENFLSVDKKFTLPHGWVYTCLINISEFIQRGKSPEYSTMQKIPVIAQKCNQKNGELSLEKALFANPASIQKYGYTKISLPNDIIINSTGTGTVGRVNILNKELFKNYETIVTDSHITTIRLVKGLTNHFYVYYFLKSPIIYDRTEERSEGSTNQIELYAKTIMGYAMPLPPKHEQDKIVTKINSLLNCIVY